MSLIGSQDQYARRYQNLDLYKLKKKTQANTSEENMRMYADESYLFLGEEPLCLSNLEAQYLQSPSPNDPIRYYDEDTMKLKFQEFESVLFDDDSFGQGMEIDGMLNESPKESSPSNSSNLTSISNSSNNNNSSSKELLFDCATLISEGNIREASIMIDDLRQRFSIQGDPSQRIAAYMVEALAARLAASGKGLYKALKCKEPLTNDQLSAMQVLFEVCPCFRFGFMAANGAIIEACKGERKVHIIDFDINQGSQYITLIQTLAKLPGKKIHLRLTGVDDPESVQRSIGGLKLIGQRLKMLSDDLKLPFEFHAVPSKIQLVSPAMLNCIPGETLIVNFAFQLHHMPDESVSTVNHRDRLLRMVKSMNPKLMTVVEQDMNTNTSPFLQRFSEAYDYYSAVFDSLEATLPRDSPDRLNVENQCLARDIVNVVACEGEERIERYEVAGKWRARMTMAGFVSCPMSSNVNDSIRKLIKQYSERFTLKEETGALHFGWKDRILVVASAWR
ncbi:scarecrow-like protein 1 [Impatiens glandulifera]|uniref:scarecrow-like protein 1 n=1 Tax=Impatiens glandulifera TaxID=253017 RepID=UPI001FB0EAB1|nr:scarecrow-like protein 1 [Impatiens glandulifera]